MKGKGNGISYPIKLSISKLPLEISCILVLEHLSTLERKKRDDFFFFPVFESSGLWKIALCGGKADLASLKNNKKTDYVKLCTKERIV